MFQSTHPCGVRPARKVFGCLSPGVSIHAPLRGATLGLPTAVPNCRSFNPRTPAGCDISPWLWSAVPRRFQSTHPCGVRRERDYLEMGDWRRFNPRTPAGCDHWSRVLGIGAVRFNPRTPAGCDCRYWPDWISALLFQSTHPCGVRHTARLPTAGAHGVSIHAPLRGATIGQRRPAGFQRGFNPRTPAGCDLVSSAKGSSHTCFNPRTPAGCDGRGSA